MTANANRDGLNRWERATEIVAVLAIISASMPDLALTIVGALLVGIGLYGSRSAGINEPTPECEPNYQQNEGNVENLTNGFHWPQSLRLPVDRRCINLDPHVRRLRNHLSGHRFAVVLLLGCASAIYLLWRALFTINSVHLLWSVAFLVAEASFSVFAIPFWISTLTPTPSLKTDRTFPRPGGTVDVFIVTYNEDPSLVRLTVLAAKNASHPHNTFICDDGNRPAIRDLAECLSVGYVARPNNLDFKAGNLNNALRHTCGEFVVVLDADHIVHPKFLDRLMPFFFDESVGFVQIPQIYYNTSSFQHTGNRSDAWHEAALFHHAIQPGMGTLNACMFVGTGTILRRRALEDIGGFAIGTITEDVHTGLRLHSRGWRSVYVDEPLGVLLAPESISAYATQRLRWCRGAMQILRRENPLTVPGLTSIQRLSYLSCPGVYLLSWSRLVLYLGPIGFLGLGWSPIALKSNLALGVIAGKLTLDHLIAWVTTRPHCRPMLSAVFHFLNTPIAMRGTLSLFPYRGLRFSVTDKGQQSGNTWYVLLPVAGLVFANAIAAGIGLRRWGENDLELIPAFMGTLFAISFATLGTIAVLYAWDRRRHDGKSMLACSAFGVWNLDTDPPGGELGQDGQQPIHVDHIGIESSFVRTDRRMKVGERGTLNLRGSVSARFPGTVGSSHPLPEGAYVSRLDFDADESSNAPIGTDSHFPWDELCKLFFRESLAERQTDPSEQDGSSPKSADCDPEHYQIAPSLSIRRR